MSKWFITDGGDSPQSRRTIIDAATENAAMQIARDTFGKDATWKPMTDEQAAATASFMGQLDEVRDAAGQLGRQLTAHRKRVMAHYNRKGVPEAVFDALCAMAMNSGSDVEPTEPPFPAILDAVLLLAKNRAEWAECIGRVQTLIWQGVDRLGAEKVGFDEAATLVRANAPDTEILDLLANYFIVPEDHEGAVAAIVLQLATVRRPELGINWAEYYVHVLSMIAAACEFDMDLAW